MCHKFIHNIKIFIIISHEFLFQNMKKLLKFLEARWPWKWTMPCMFLVQWHGPKMTRWSLTVDISLPKTTPLSSPIYASQTRESIKQWMNRNEWWPSTFCQSRQVRPVSYQDPFSLSRCQMLWSWLLWRQIFGLQKQEFFIFSVNLFFEKRIVYFFFLAGLVLFDFNFIWLIVCSGFLLFFAFFF